MTSESWILICTMAKYILESSCLFGKSFYPNYNMIIIINSFFICKVWPLPERFRCASRHFEGEVNNLIFTFTLFYSSNLLSWKLFRDKIPTFSKYYICPFRFWWKAHSHSYVNTLKNHLFAIVSIYRITLKLRLSITHMDSFLRITHSPLF